MAKFIDRTGEENLNKQGLKMKIIKYKNNHDIDIQFDDGYISYNKEYRSFKNGNINNPNYDYCKKKNRLGEEIKIKNFTAKIIEYKDARHITVKILETGEIFKNQCYKNFIQKNIKSQFEPNIRNKGYLGGETCVDEDGNQLRSYDTWSGMIERCYSEKYHEKEPSYKNCEVCEEWLNYSNFKKWYNDNYYEIEGYRMHLDKDILVKGNKIYSPSTCIFVPQNINSLFVKKSLNKGNNLIGVFYDNSKDYVKKYKVTISKNNKRKYLGHYKTEIEAFYAYKEAKEKYIKQVADEYKDKIPQKLYEAMYRYEVEITD